MKQTFYRVHCQTTFTLPSRDWVPRDINRLDSCATTNASESFNCVLKNLQNSKEVPGDCMSLSLLRLQQYYLSEIVRVFSDDENYPMRTFFKALAIKVC